jgi:hypothetical protein
MTGTAGWSNRVRALALVAGLVAVSLAVALAGCDSPGTPTPVSASTQPPVPNGADSGVPTPSTAVPVATATPLPAPTATPPPPTATPTPAPVADLAGALERARAAPRTPVDGLQAPLDRKTADAVRAAMLAAGADLKGIQVGVVHGQGDDEIAVLILDETDGYKAPPDDELAKRILAPLANAPALGTAHVTRISVMYRARNAKTGKVQEMTMTMPLDTLRAALAAAGKKDNVKADDLLKNVIVR